ncbi:MAG: alpha/beta hydrolase [Chloroflexi bacterium]|nr:alpha/beta hydrolase [Chloroflexota bacterium]
MAGHENTGRGTLEVRRVAAGVGIALALLLALGIWAGASGMLDQHFLYFPTSELIGSPAVYGLDYEDVYFETSDGRRLHGWFVPGESDVTLLWHHGNGGNIGYRLPDIDLFHRELGVNILIYDYRGYGRSAGTPSEEGLYRDAEAALRYLQSRDDVDPTKIVYFGRSLGVAIATELATRHRPYGLILESGFPSIEYMSEIVRPWLPAWVVHRIIAARYDTASKIGALDVPILIVHGDADDTVPLRAGQALFDAASEPKSFYTVEGANHDDISEVGGRQHIERLREYIAGLG